jgi:hypothetical protein
VNLCRFLLSFVYIYVLTLEIQYKRGGLEFNVPSPHICACPKPVTEFPMSYVIVVFVFSELGWEVIAHFVDIGGIGAWLSFYSGNIFFVMQILYSTSSNIIPIIHKIYLNILIITSHLLNIYILLWYIFLTFETDQFLLYTGNMFSNQYFYNIFTL